MSELEIYDGRIGGFYEICELLQWPRTQVRNKLTREMQLSDYWMPGQMPRAFMRVHATPLFDLDEYVRFIQSSGYHVHRFEGE